MKKLPKPPFFEIGIKNYIYGDDVLRLALAADAAAKKYDIDVLFTTPYVEIRRVAENTDRLIVIAPHMDTLKPGRGQADILPEAIKAAGAKGVMINHCEKPLSLADIRLTIIRANELDLFSFVCADSIDETRAVTHLYPDIINPEPTELIGTDSMSDISYVMESIKAVKEICPNILVELAAGISSGEQVYDVIMAGADAVGVASGIVNAKDPYAMVDEMINSIRRAHDDIRKKYLRGDV
jgi:triosephosphate isomerase